MGVRCWDHIILLYKLPEPKTSYMYERARAAFTYYFARARVAVRSCMYLYTQ